MKTLNATDAKARLAEILRAVELGESFEITRHGKAIARVTPASLDDDDARRAAVERFRAARKKWRDAGMTRQEILDARHAGHRA